jgi:hypothetical protein
MNCESYDWKAYALGELDRAARKEAEAHAAFCADCREQAAALRLTLDTLSTLREEEMPRRIAFVSDKIFEPRWWQKMIWSPNFAAACVIAVAILVHAFARTGDNSAQTQAQIDAAVNKAVAEVEARHEATLAAYISRSDYMYATAAGLKRQ